MKQDLRNLSGALSALLVFAACEDDGDSIAERDGDILYCGEERVIDASLLDEELARDPLLAEALGFGQVNDCATAEGVLAAIEESGDASDPAPPSAGPDDDLTDWTPPPQPMMGSTVRVDTWATGVVKIVFQTRNVCTGAMIGRGIVATAAHCLWPRIQPKRDFNAWVRIEYTKSNGTIYCLSSGTVGQCTADSLHRFVIHPQWSAPTSGVHVEHDVGLILSNHTCSGQRCWQNTGTSDFLRIYDDSLHKDIKHRVWGYGALDNQGTFDGRLRSGPIDIDYWTAEAIRDEIHILRLCQMDSGGPWANFDHHNGWYLISGLTVGGQASGSCASVGQRQWAMRLGAKIGWIQSVAGVTCVQGVSPDKNKVYRRCW